MCSLLFQNGRSSNWDPSRRRGRGKDIGATIWDHQAGRRHNPTNCKFPLKIPKFPNIVKCADLYCCSFQEYYFSDANLRRDKFLLKQISENEGGWVELAVLLTFKRLKSMSEEASVIASAVLKSSEGLVEVSEDKLKLRRHPEHRKQTFLNLNRI